MPKVRVLEIYKKTWSVASFMVREIINFQPKISFIVILTVVIRRTKNELIYAYMHYDV